MTEITNLSEQPRDYSRDIRSATNLTELRAATERWKKLAADANAVAQAMTEQDWPEYARGKKAEAAGEFGGDEWYGKYKDILFPDVLFKVAMMTNELDAPWGLTFQRLVQEGRVTESNGVFEFKGLV